MTTSSNKSVRYRNRQKQRAVEHLGGKCVRCGYSKCLAAMDFHHTDVTNKDWNPSRVMSYRWDIIEKEINKCELVCANCHRELHEGVTEFAKLRSANGHRKTYVKTCLTCNREFTAAKEQNKYCSVDCYRQSSRNQSRPTSK